MKICPKCKSNKIFGDFYKNKSTKDGLSYYCIECESKRKKKRYKENEDIRKTAKNNYQKWYQNNKHKQQESAQRYRRKYPERILFYMAKDRSKNKNIEFNIEIEDIKIPEYCPILNIKLKNGRIENKEKSPSLDKIDNSKGYIKGNIRVISLLANQMKSIANREQLELFSKNIIKYMDGEI